MSAASSKKFIPAETDQKIAVGHAFTYRGDGGAKCRIAAGMPENIVAELEFIQINNGKTDFRTGILDFFFVIVAVVYAGQHIVPRIFLITAEPVFVFSAISLISVRATAITV